MQKHQKRLFLGIPIEPSLISDLNLFLKHQNFDPKNRWIPLENLHVTVFFIGDTPVDWISDFSNKLSVFYKSKPSFKLEFEKYSLMPYKEPRMIWARFYENPIFKILVAGTANCVNKKMNKSPKPHITLARFKDGVNYKNFNLSLPVQNKQLKADKIHLYESVLHPSGAKYRILQTFLLADEQ